MIDIKDPKQAYRLNFIMNIVGKRILPCLLMNIATKKLIEWQFNACIQTSVVLNLILRDNLPDYIIESWEGQFEDSQEGKYNHAWVYCSHEDPTRNILIDTARVSKHHIFEIGVDNYPAMFLNDNISTTKELSRTFIDVDNLSDNEYYTNKPIKDLVNHIYLILKLYEK
jgi:hypothetical protein